MTTDVNHKKTLDLNAKFASILGIISTNLRNSENMKQPISTEIQQDALSIAKATQKPGQTKEQTKLIAQGIEKGIAEYKKRQKAKARERDKLRKQQLKARNQQANATDEMDEGEDFSLPQTQFTPIAWAAIALLVLSWLGFGAYVFL